MAITIESNTQTEQEIRDAFKAHGLEPRIVESKVKPAAKPEEKPSEPVEAPGEIIPAETTGESATAPEGQEKPQETPPAPTQTEVKKAKGGFQAKLEKLTARVGNLQDELDNERGDKTRLTEKLAAAQAELDKLKGGDGKPEPAKEVGPVRPKRPEMPEMADFEYDADKFQAAMKQYRGDLVKYDEELETYNTARTELKVAEGIAAQEERQKQAKIEEITVKAQNDFVALRDKQAADYGDEWQELLDDEPKWVEISPVLPQLIFESEQPSHLMMYLYKHPEELEQIGDMSDRFGRPDLLRQTRAIGRLEDKLAAERKPNGTVKTEPKTAEVKPADIPPAKPKPRAETPDAPLKPVGARAGGGAPIDFTAQLKAAADAGDSREYRRLRALQQESNAVRAR